MCKFKLAFLFLFVFKFKQFLQQPSRKCPDALGFMWPIGKGEGVYKSQISPVLFSSPQFSVWQRVISGMTAWAFAQLPSQMQLIDVQFIFLNQRPMALPCFISISLAFTEASVLSFSNLLLPGCVQAGDMWPLWKAHFAPCYTSHMFGMLSFNSVKFYSPSETYTAHGILSYPLPELQKMENIGSL